MDIARGIRKKTDCVLILTGLDGYRDKADLLNTMVVQVAFGFKTNVNEPIVSSTCGSDPAKLLERATCGRVRNGLH